MHGCTLSARTHVCAVGNRAYRWGFSHVPGCTLSARTHVCAVGNRAYRWIPARARLETAPTGGGFSRVPGCTLSARTHVCAVGNRAYRWWVLARARLHIVSAHPTLSRLETAPIGGGFSHMHGCELRLSVAGSGICVCPVVLRIGECSRLGNLVHIEFILKTIDQRFAAGGDAVLRNADGAPGLLAIADFNQHAHF